MTKNCLASLMKWGGTDDFAPRRSLKKFDVLYIAVIADVKRRPGIHQISEQEVGVEILGCLKRGQLRVSQHGVVLKNRTQGEFAVELPVPLGAHDVVIKDVGNPGTVSEPLQNIGIVDPQASTWPQDEAEFATVQVGYHRFLAVWRDKIDARSQRVFALEVDLREIAGPEKEPFAVVGEVTVFREALEVLGPQALAGTIIKQPQIGLARELPTHGTGIKEIQAGATVVPSGVDRHVGSPGNQIFTFRAEAVTRKLPQATNVRP